MYNVDEQINKLRQVKLKILSDFYEETKERQAKVAQTLALIDEQMAVLVNCNDRIPCLVRKTPGPELTVYHAADAPCRRIHDRDNFAVMSELEAMEASTAPGYGRCPACDWDEAAKIHGSQLAQVGV